MWTIEPFALTALLRVPDGAVVVVVEDLLFPNGQIGRQTSPGTRIASASGGPCDPGS